MRWSLVTQSLNKIHLDLVIKVTDFMNIIIIIFQAQGLPQTENE